MVFRARGEDDLFWVIINGLNEEQHYYSDLKRERGHIGKNVRESLPGYKYLESTKDLSQEQIWFVLLKEKDPCGYSVPR